VKCYFNILYVKHRPTLLNNMYLIYLSANHNKDCDLAVAGIKCRHDLCSNIYEHFRLLCFYTVTLYSNVLFLFIFLLPFVWRDKVFIIIPKLSEKVSLKLTMEGRP